MSKFLLKTLLFGRPGARTNSLRWFSVSDSDEKQSFTASYLVDSLGFSREKALSVCKYVKFDSSEKPDKVIDFFQGCGFTHSQVSKLARSFPSLLLSDTEKILSPKLEFLRAKGLSEPEIAKFLSSFPRFLQASLANQILPSYDFFTSFFQSEEKTILAFKRFPDLLARGLSNVVPKILTLRDHRVPDSHIATLLLNRPRYFNANAPVARFREGVEKVAQMGFKASSLKFVLAVLVLDSTRKRNWQRKIEAYKKWGWSDEDFSNAFQLDPQCMLISESNIKASMSFFIAEMGFKPCFIAKHPAFMLYSLKKRVVPRFSVLQVLLSKGLVKEDEKMVSLLRGPEEKFLQKFVAPFQEEAPELLMLYKEKRRL